MGNRPLLDLALERLHGLDVAVNTHHLASQVVEHLHDTEVHVAVEPGEALGTAGGVAHLRPWIDGRHVEITNGDAWLDADLADLRTTWDRSTVRLAVVEDLERPDFDGRWRFAGVSLMPWDAVARLPNGVSGLYEEVWAPARRAGSLELIDVGGRFVDCGTPGAYWQANMLWSGGESVVHPTATVAGDVVRSVLWPHAEVKPGERLVDAIRLPDGRTVSID